MAMYLTDLQGAIDTVNQVKRHAGRVGITYLRQAGILGCSILAYEQKFLLEKPNAALEWQAGRLGWRS